MNTLTQKGINLLDEGHAEIMRLFHVASSGDMFFRK